jgi:hypothetical protein
MGWRAAAYQVPVGRCCALVVGGSMDGSFEYVRGARVEGEAFPLQRLSPAQRPLKFPGVLVGQAEAEACAVILC